MRKKLSSPIALTLVWVLLAALGSSAQGTFQWHAKLDTVTQAGFYRIGLSPELVAKCREDLGDLRIRDRENKFVSYVLKTEEPGQDGYQRIQDPAIRQTDSIDRHSYITLSYAEPYRVDKLTIEISTPLLYKRRVELYDPKKNIDWPVTTFYIDPAHASFAIPSSKTNRLALRISNADNAPLVIRRVETEQLKEYLLAYLRPGEAYLLQAGSIAAGPPDYDLKYFVDSLTGNPQEIGFGPLQKDSPPFEKPAVRSANDHSGLFLWSIILVVLVLLASLSFRLVKAAGEKDKERSQM